MVWPARNTKSATGNEQLRRRNPERRACSLWPVVSVVGRFLKELIETARHGTVADARAVMPSINKVRELLYGGGVGPVPRLHDIPDRGFYLLQQAGAAPWVR